MGSLSVHSVKMLCDVKHLQTIRIILMLIVYSYEDRILNQSDFTVGWDTYYAGGMETKQSNKCPVAQCLL